MKPPERALPLLTVAALALRIAFLLLEPATQPIADEKTWTNWAVENLITPKVRFSPFNTHMIFYPPLYPYFIAVAYAVGGTLTAVKWVQALVSALLVPAVGRLGRMAFGPRIGLLAAGIVAFYPEIVWFSAHFWSETLFMLFLWWAFERLVAADASGRAGAAALAGLLWGLAILTRETVLYATPLAALWLGLARRPRAPARGAAFLIVALLTVAPWTYRNWVVFQAFVPVSTAGGLNLWQGNARLTRQEVYDRYEAVHGRIEQYRHARRMGLEAIRERQPLWIFEKLGDEMPRFWEADSLALIHIKRGAYDSVTPAVAVLAGVAVLVPYLVVLGLFIVGLVSLSPDRAQWLLLGFLAYYNLIHVATHGFARYRLPAMPVVFLVAAFAWIRLRDAGAPALSRARWFAAAALGLLFLLLLVPSFRLNLRDPAFGLMDAGESPEALAPP